MPEPVLSTPPLQTDSPPRAQRSGVFWPLLAILGVALAARLWQLDSVPPAFFSDECDNTVFAIRILQHKGPGLYGFDWKPQPALAVHLIAGSLWTVGPSVLAVRLPSALLSVFALVPFFWLARRATADAPALLATLLLALHPGYLHFSRSGWENVQVCFWTLLAMEAVLRGIESGRRRPWAIAGAFAAIGAMTYFSGRAIPVFIGAYALTRWIWGPREDRRETAEGLFALACVFSLLVAPLLPRIIDEWELFNLRTSDVLFTRDLPADATSWDALVSFLRNGFNSFLPFLGVSGGIQPRYFPPYRGVLDGAGAALFVLGLIVGWRRRQSTGLWWFAFAIPFVLTQMITKWTPDLARGIALVPIAHLFIALGLDSLLRFLRALSPADVAVPLLAGWILANGANDYASYTTSPYLAANLEPAVALEDFDAWWVYQNQSIREDRGFFTVDAWLARKRKEP